MIPTEKRILADVRWQEPWKTPAEDIYIYGGRFHTNRPTYTSYCRAIRTFKCSASLEYELEADLLAPRPSLTSRIRSSNPNMLRLQAQGSPSNVLSRSAAGKLLINVQGGSRRPKVNDQDHAIVSNRNLNIIRARTNKVLTLAIYHLPQATPEKYKGLRLSVECKK